MEEGFGTDWATDWLEVWFAATRQAPGLGDQMASILRAESDRTDDSD
jgi:hypothetical protein